MCLKNFYGLFFYRSCSNDDDSSEEGGRDGGAMMMDCWAALHSTFWAKSALSLTTGAAMASSVASALAVAFIVVGFVTV